jgi:hypothetical protein
VAGLYGRDTAYDFHTASTDKAVHFISTMCNDGVCLANLDWDCGFTIDILEFDSEKYGNWDEAVVDCFYKLLRIVPLYTSLDKVRKICGRHYMQFDPLPELNREECEAEGGKWGIAKPIWSDEEALLREAGIL